MENLENDILASEGLKIIFQLRFLGWNAEICVQLKLNNLASLACYGTSVNSFLAFYWVSTLSNTKKQVRMQHYTEEKMEKIDWFIKAYVDMINTIF